MSRQPPSPTVQAMSVQDLKDAVQETRFDLDYRSYDWDRRGAPPPPAEGDNVQVPPAKQEELEFTPQYASGLPLLLAMVAINLSVFLIYLDTSILATAIPTITNEFHSTGDIGWYVSSYQLALSALQPSTGKLFTYLNNKWTYVAFLFLFEVGSLVCGLATSSPMLIVGRTVAGLGASGLFNGALTILSALVPLQRRPTMLGALMGFSQLGLIAGPLIGGALTEFTTWRWCFNINLPIGGLSMAMLALVHIPEQRAKPPLATFLATPGLARKFDLVGTAILSPAVVMLLLALDLGGNDYPWSSPVVIGLLVAAVATCALFIVWEWRGAGGDNALIPLGLFRNKVVVAACLTNSCLASVAFISASFIPVYFQSVQGDSAFMSGVSLLPSIISQLLTTLLSGPAVSRFGYYLPWSLACAVLTSVGCGLVTTWSATTGPAEWIAYQIILGIGRGAGLQMAMVAVQTVLPDTQVAVVMAVVVFVQGLGSSVFVSVASTILNNSLAAALQAQAQALGGGVDIEAVLAAGATAFRGLVPADALGVVVGAYAAAFRNVFYLATGLSVAMCFTIWGLGWGDVRRPQKQQDKGGESGETSSTTVEIHDKDDKDDKV